jgi:ADP-ribose pyrophosphatase YjhB (NUDIX family)
MAGLPERAKRLGFRTWGRLPGAVRSFLIHRGTPSFHVGAICVIERADGALLLVRNSYRRGWGFPGGLLNRGEAPFDAARRETHEEVGVDVVLDDNPKVVVDPHHRRVDVIFTGQQRAGEDQPARPRSPEILEARWFPVDALPDLQPEAVAALIELGRAQRPPLELD